MPAKKTMPSETLGSYFNISPSDYKYTPDGSELIGPSLCFKAYD